MARKRATMREGPLAELFRKIAPRAVRAGLPEHRLHKQPIVLGRYPHMPFTSGQNILDPVPLIVPKGVAAHLSASNQLTAYESREAILGNLDGYVRIKPRIDDRP